MPSLIPSSDLAVELKAATASVVSLVQAIYRERVHFAICERMSGLAWHGSGLLYSASEGYAAAVNAAEPRASIDLSGVIRRLPGMGGGGDSFDVG